MSADDDPNDPRLFHAAIGTVRRIRDDRADLRIRRPKPKALQRRQDEVAATRLFRTDPVGASELQPGDELEFLRAGMQRKIVRNLRRGRYRIEEELDLHGLVSAEADQVLRTFLTDCIYRRLQCVRIIHGKGHRSSPQGPVLKYLVDSRLRQRDDVLAFCSAPPNDGGTGAVYVLLQRPSRLYGREHDL